MPAPRQCGQSGLLVIGSLFGFSGAPFFLKPLSFALRYPDLFLAVRRRCQREPSRYAEIKRVELFDLRDWSTLMEGVKAWETATL